MSRTRKIWTSLLILGAIIAVVVLSSSISNTTYVLGANLGSEIDLDVQDQFVEEEVSIGNTGLAEWQQYLIIGLLVMATTVGIIVDRKRFLAAIVAAALIIAVIFLMGQRTESAEMPEIGFNPSTSETIDAPVDGARLETPILQEPQAPEAGVALISYLLIAIVVAIAGGVAIVLWRRFGKREPAPPLKDIATQAEATIANIEAGDNLRDAIMQCYRQMNSIVATSQGMRRDQGMTPREFETSLVSGGLPKSSVERLTRLFESVRYGDSNPGKREELEALSALREIVDYVNAENDAKLARQAAAQIQPDTG